MANKKISELEQVLDTNNSDVLPIVQNSVTKKVSVSQLLNRSKQELTNILNVFTKYYIGEVETLSLTFPTIANNGEWCYICFESRENATELTITNENIVGNTDIIPQSNKTYEIYAEYNGSNWVIQYLGY